MSIGVYIHLSKPEKVLPSFFNLLACHKLLCNENDRIRLNYEICLNTPPDSDYIKFFKKSENYKAKWDYLSLVKEKLKHKNDDPTAELALDLISYGNATPFLVLKRMSRSGTFRRTSTSNATRRTSFRLLLCTAVTDKRGRQL